jgi:tetratricopeptide (TPR) repeat protein
MLNDAILHQLREVPAEGLASHIASLTAEISETDVQDLAEAARKSSTDNPTEALRLAEIALQLAVVLKMPRIRAMALRACGVSLKEQGRWAEAVASFDAGVEAAASAGEELLAAQIPIAKIDALAQLGAYDEAFAFAAALENRLQALGAAEDAAKVMWNVGNIHFRREAYSLAGVCWRKALAYFEAQDNKIATGRLQMNVANVLTHLNRLAEALEMYQSARAALTETHNARAIAFLDSNIGFHQYMGGRYTEALQSYTRARYRLEELELPQEVAQCDRETADVYLQLNLVPEALETFERIIPTFRQLAMTGEVARSEMGLSLALASEDRHADALQALERAEQGFRKEGNRIGVARARLQRTEWWRREKLMQNAAPSEQEIVLQNREANGAMRTFRAQGARVGVLQAPAALWRRLSRGVSSGQDAPLRRAARPAAGPKHADGDSGVLSTGRAIQVPYPYGATGGGHTGKRRRGCRATGSPGSSGRAAQPVELGLYASGAGRRGHKPPDPCRIDLVRTHSGTRKRLSSDAP